MRTLYQASNSLEAHMLVDVLRQQGLRAHIAGEHLQGAMGELPASGLVRLLIDEPDYDAARRAIADWEAAQPVPEPIAPAARQAPGFAWPTFLLGLLVGWLLAQLG